MRFLLAASLIRRLKRPKKRTRRRATARQAAIYLRMAARAQAEANRA